jgi:predicted Holliday junction resolvase-like endonuclease
MSDLFNHPVFWGLVVSILFNVYLLSQKKSLKEEARHYGMELHEKWKEEIVPQIRKDAIEASKRVQRGKNLEQLTPFISNFPYDPADCRFLGSPIDLVVFNGLSQGELQEVIFLEIKSGQQAQLPNREKQLRDCIKSGRVGWQMVRL